MRVTLINNMKSCYCGSSLSFDNCCQIYINGTLKAPTAEALMRSRYSAFASTAIDYLIETTHPSTRKSLKKQELSHWSTSNHWIKLEVLEATETTVQFKAYYLDSQLVPQIHHEFSTFKKESGLWYYEKGTFRD